MRVRIFGRNGRLGGKIAAAFFNRGDEITNGLVDLNYLIFAHRYRGPADYEEEMRVNLRLVWEALALATWAEGPKVAVIIGSACARDPAMHETLAYNLSKAALPQVARYYNQIGPMFCVVLEPGAMRGDAVETPESVVVDQVISECKAENVRRELVA